MFDKNPWCAFLKTIGPKKHLRVASYALLFLALWGFQPTYSDNLGKLRKHIFVNQVKMLLFPLTSCVNHLSNT